MARAIWTGSISLGLVNIPVRLYSAVRDRDLHFHLLRAEDHCRVRRKLVCPADDEEVKTNETVRGVEVAPDQYVVLEDDELDSLRPEAQKTIDILDFVALAEIDPVAFERPYYLAPTPQAAKSYRVLLDAMAQQGRVAIGKFVMRNKEHLVALRPADGAMILEIMRFQDELVAAAELGDLPDLERIKVDERERKMAEQLIESLTVPFNHAAYRDEYRERVAELVERKVAGEDTHADAGREEATAPVVDLMAALEASLKQAKQRRQRVTAKAS
jgi:DNA end-binding protein Ku